jgi:hypothetical protein
MRALFIRSNENKMSDGGRERGSIGVEVWKSSQMWSVRRSAVRSIAWLGLRGRITGNFPSKLLLEIAKARLANPVIIIDRNIPLVQYVWSLFYHKFRPSECTMIVVPIPVRGVAAIWTVNENHATKIFFLSAESPVRSVCHARGKDLTRISSATADGSELSGRFQC